MTDNKARAGSDRRFISLDEDYEVRYWTSSLGTTEERLRQAIKAVGNQPANVRDYLKKTGQTNR